MLSDLFHQRRFCNPGVHVFPVDVVALCQDARDCDLPKVVSDRQFVLVCVVAIRFSLHGGDVLCREIVVVHGEIHQARVGCRDGFIIDVLLEVRRQVALCHAVVLEKIGIGDLDIDLVDGIIGQLQVDVRNGNDRRLDFKGHFDDRTLSDSFRRKGDLVAVVRIFLIELTAAGHFDLFDLSVRPPVVSRRLDSGYLLPVLVVGSIYDFVVRCIFSRFLENFPAVVNSYRARQLGGRGNPDSDEVAPV